MTDYLDSMARWAETQGYGVYEPTDASRPSIYVLRKPDDVALLPDEYLAFVPRGGASDRTFGTLQARPNVTVIVRGARNDPSGPHDVSWRLYYAMDAIVNEEVEGTYFLRWENNITPDWTDQDSEGRSLYTTDWTVWLDAI
jgi:hypothetical protein